MTAEPISFFSGLCYTARDLASKLKHTLPRMRNAYQLRNLQCGIAASEREDIRVNYGSLGAPLAPGHSVVIGGAVKLLHLYSQFPHVENGFNLIYLVSSALPAYAVDFVHAAKARGCKLIWNQNGVAYPAWCGDFYPWFNRSMRELIHLADFVIYQSQFCQSSADRYLGKVSAANAVLFNPVDTRIFSPAERPPPFSRCELLAAGTSHHFYRVSASLETLSVLREVHGVNARLTLAGQFRWRGGEAEVRDAICKKKLENHVRILPAFTQEQAVAIYRDTHILLHPKYKDPCPTVPIEAMAVGIPVVGSKSGGMPELVPPAAGILAEVPEDWTRDHAPAPQDLAAAVIHIMSDYAHYSSAARQHALQAFGRDYWLEAHKAIFRTVIKGSL